MSWAIPSFSDILTAKKAPSSSEASLVEKQAQIKSIWKPILNEDVEARFRGREKYIKGKVVKVSENDMYDINYYDGGKEVSVHLSLIKKARVKFNYKIFSARTTPSVLDMDKFALGRVMVDFEPSKAFQ